MTHWRGAVLLGCSSLLLAALAGLPAEAVAPAKVGWWNAAQLAGAALPLPPTTAAGDLHLGQGAQGPTAYAAVDYPAAAYPAAAFQGTGQQVSAAVLELALVPNSVVGTPAVTACRITSTSWQPAENGPVSAAPQYDCATGAVPGFVSADGKTLTFLLGATQQQAGGFNLALVPAADSQPFQLDLSKVGPSSLTLTDSPTAQPAAPPPVPPASDGGTGGGPPHTLPIGMPISPPGMIDPALFPLPPTVVGTIPPPTLAGPRAPALSAVLGTAPVVVPVALLAPLDNRARYLAGSLLAVIAGALLWSAQLRIPQPRLLGGLARTVPVTPLPVEGPPVVGGIGRFAAVRTGPPRRLL